MDKNFIPYEESVALEELGFNEPCFAGYSILTEKIEFYSKPLLTRDSFTVDAPTYSQAFRWFRDNHGFYNQIHKGYGWEGIIRNSVNGDIEWNDGTYNSPEEAELACLKKLIEIVKNNE
jgi:hypothetical protein